MRRTHGPLDMIYAGQPCRMLILEADSESALDEALQRARAKGWSDYLDGRVPSDGWYSAWMLKATDAMEPMPDSPIQRVAPPAGGATTGSLPGGVGDPGWSGAGDPG
jgi:hypothetical protein